MPIHISVIGYHCHYHPTLCPHFHRYSFLLQCFSSFLVLLSLVHFLQIFSSNIHLLLFSPSLTFLFPPNSCFTPSSLQVPNLFLSFLCKRPLHIICSYLKSCRSHPCSLSSPLIQFFLYVSAVHRRISDSVFLSRSSSHLSASLSIFHFTFLKAEDPRSFPTISLTYLPLFSLRFSPVLLPPFPRTPFPVSLSLSLSVSSPFLHLSIPLTSPRSLSLPICFPVSSRFSFSSHNILLILYSLLSLFFIS